MLYYSPVSSRTRFAKLRIARSLDWSNEVLFADFSHIIQDHVGLDGVLALRRTCKQAPLAVAFKPKEACELLDEHGQDDPDKTGLAFYAACWGELLLLQFAMRRGCNTKSVCFAAASTGHFECLKWLHEQGCPWNTCDKAAAECLKYAREPQGSDQDASDDEP